MSEFIGVKKLSDFQTNLSFKKDALIFDRIAVSDIGHFARMILEGGDRNNFGYYSQEFKWLLENGIVFQPKFTSLENKDFSSNNLSNSIEELRKEHEKLPEKLRLNIETDFWNWWNTLNDYMTRSLASSKYLYWASSLCPVRSFTAPKPRPIPTSGMALCVREATSD